MSVLIYSTARCGYCVRAKAWFESKNIAYDEIVLDNQEAIAKFKDDCPGATTVPQILVDRELIGGYDTLMEKQEYVIGLLQE